MAYKVFISYRRVDTGAEAARLRKELLALSPRIQVFLDVYNIGYGKEFMSELTDRIREVDAFVFLIGPRWNPQRLLEPNDPVAHELTVAFKEKKLVIPVLIADTKVPKKEEIPPEYRYIFKVNAAPIRADPFFVDDVKLLISKGFGLKLIPKQEIDGDISRSFLAILGIPLIILVLLVVMSIIYAT